MSDGGQSYITLAWLVRMSWLYGGVVPEYAPGRKMCYDLGIIYKSSK